MKRTMAIVALALLSACATQQKQEAKLLESTLRSYASVMRWGDAEQAVAFIDPEIAEKNPVDRITLERFKQVQIAGYRERAPEMTGPQEATQVVQIDLVNRHTQEVRSLVDVQRWRYDAEKKRWWLVSGLPDLTAKPR